MREFGYTGRRLDFAITSARPLPNPGGVVNVDRARKTTMNFIHLAAVAGRAVAGFPAEVEALEPAAPLQERGVPQQGQQSIHDRGQTQQHHEQLEKLRQSRVGTELVDHPKKDRAEDDGYQNSDDERDHRDPPRLS
jgi:hypothetical protein